MTDEYWKERFRFTKPTSKYVKDLCEDRDKALTYTKPCPTCTTEQVQLVLWTPTKCGWKCRHCKHEWEITYEV